MRVDFFAGQQEFLERFVNLKNAHAELRELVETVKKQQKAGKSRSSTRTYETTHVSDTLFSNTALTDGMASSSGLGINHSPRASETVPLASTPKESLSPAKIGVCSQSPIKAKSGNYP